MCAYKKDTKFPKKKNSVEVNKINLEFSSLQSSYDNLTKEERKKNWRGGKVYHNEFHKLYLRALQYSGGTDLANRILKYMNEVREEMGEEVQDDNKAQRGSQLYFSISKKTSKRQEKNRSRPSPSPKKKW